MLLPTPRNESRSSRIVRGVGNIGQIPQARVSSGLMELSVVTDLQAAEKLASAWSQLLRCRGDSRYFHEPEWLLQCWRAREAGNRHPFLVTAGDVANLRCVWALEAQPRIRGLRSFGPLSIGPPYYNDMQMARDVPPEVAGWVFDFARKFARADLALFEKVEPASTVGQLLAARGGMRETIAAPRVELAGFADHDSFVRDRLRTSFRKDQRRRRRRFQELGRAEFEMYVGTAVPFRLIDWVLKSKADWLRRRPGKADAIATAEFAAFVRSVWSASSRSGRLYLGVLRLDDRPAAAEFGFVHRRVMSSWMAAYDEALASFAPGRLLIEDCIRWCIQAGFEAYDFLPSEAGYKKDWSSTNRRVCDHLAPTSAAGRTYLAWRKSHMRNWLARYGKALANRSPAVAVPEKV